MKTVLQFVDRWPLKGRNPHHDPGIQSQRTLCACLGSFRCRLEYPEVGRGPLVSDSRPAGLCVQLMSLMASIEFELLMHILLEMENATGNQVYECFLWLPSHCCCGCHRRWIYVFVISGNLPEIRIVFVGAVRFGNLIFWRLVISF